MSELNSKDFCYAQHIRGNSKISEKYTNKDKYVVQFQSTQDATISLRLFEPNVTTLCQLIYSHSSHTPTNVILYYILQYIINMHSE